jgi:small-conductance mechanosensitive channel
MGIHGEDRQEQGERRRVSWDLAEIMGYALVVILVIFLSVCVAAASTRGSQLGPDTGNGVLGFANRFDLGEVLEQASAWASPQFATLFIFGSLGMVWWQIETWSPDEGEMLASEASAHLARATFLLLLDRVISALCVVGGIVLVIAGFLLATPGEFASSSLTSIGLGLGSVVVGCVGLVASRRLSQASISVGTPGIS